MSKLSSLIDICVEEKPFIDFESSIDNDQVISGYVPVRSTMEVFEFLKSATSQQTSEGRAVIAHGSYGTGKSRMCSVLARLFKDGFDSPSLQPVWERLSARGESNSLSTLKDIMMPGGRAWHPWLVVPMYAGAGGGTLSACLIRALVKTLRKNGIDDSVLGKTVYHAAAHRLDEMLSNGADFVRPTNSPYTTAEQLGRALTQDLDEKALDQFKVFHLDATHGVPFQDYVQATGGVALKAHEVFNTVSASIQQHGYDGIIIIWDEFGFAVEELLRGSQKGDRRIGQEAIDLQDFLEKSCASQALGKRTIFLGFTHVGLSEYGSREGLGKTDQDRLATVEHRFRDPSIHIRLGLAENEGYHLLAGMLRRSPSGVKLFDNPIPNLQGIAERMPRLNLWKQLAAHLCYDDIVAPCYPLQPAAAMALLTLSEQIAQVNRTTFYFLQNKTKDGFAGHLESTDIPVISVMGFDELVRPHHLFPFFEDALRAGKTELFDQYKEAVTLYPDADSLQLAVLQTVLILFVIARSDLSPTTDFLCFCLSDHLGDEAQSKPVHDALSGLSQANVLWKNAATDVWSFVGRRGVNTEIDDALSQEKELVPRLSASELLAKFPQVQKELCDRIGDFPIEPCNGGIIRQFGVRILDISQGDNAIEEVNPARFGNGGSIVWRSALIYLVASNNSSQLDHWRQKAANLQNSNVYFVFPPAPLAMESDAVRNLIAVQNLLQKTAKDDHAYNVLEGMLTNFRDTLRSSFEQSFGNSGLRSGTAVLKAGNSNTYVPVASWSELLPSIAKQIDNEYSHQIRVRCGSYNEWKTSMSWGPITGIVQRILKFDETTEYKAELLGFTETTQEAAIVDGVLVENGFLTQNALTREWEIPPIDEQCTHKAMVEIYKHFRSGGGGKEFRYLFAKLVDAPYGIPNGIIPILVALVFRTEQARIGVYSRSGGTGGQLQSISPSKLSDAITDMAKHPRKYETRYTRLSRKQRFVFRVIGPLVNVPLDNKSRSGEPFYEFCGNVRSALKSWIAHLPESVLKLPDLSEHQKQLVKALRGPVPPHISALADILVDIISDDKEALAEALDVETTQDSFPATEALWNNLYTRVNRYVEGVKAPFRSMVREITGSSDTYSAPEKIRSALSNIPAPPPGSALNQVLMRLDNTPMDQDPLDYIVSAIADKSITHLSEEDYGRAVGVLEVVDLFQKARGNYSVTLPSGLRKDLPFLHNRSTISQIAENVASWQVSLSIADDELAGIILEAIYGEKPHLDTIAPTPECVNEGIDGDYSNDAEPTDEVT